MNQNNYNVCGRCGSANPLSARYCYQCGFELKSPEAPVVCTKCNTVNPGSANFCKRCGSKLPKAQSKVICPQCSAANNAESTYCSNCGYDFTTHTMPPSVAARQISQAAATDVMVTKAAPPPDLSKKEKRRLKREEEERAYKEAYEAKKAAKLQKKQEKQLKKQRADAAQTVVQPMSAPQYQYVPPMATVQPMAQYAAEPVRTRPNRRWANIVCLIVALVGLYLILYPAQIAINGFSTYLGLYADQGIAVQLTGWDVIIACLANFTGAVSFLSDAVANSGNVFNSFDIYVTAVVTVAAALSLLVYVVAKIVGVCTGKRHNGVDGWALFMTIALLALSLSVYFLNFTAIEFSENVFIFPAVFLLITVFNSGRRYDR